MMKAWQTKTLGEVLQKTETVNPLQSPQAEFDYIDVSSVSNTTFRIEATQRLNGRDAPSRARKLVRANDILFATIRPTLQRIAIVPERLDKQVCSTGYFVLRPRSDLDHRFVFYWLFTEKFIGQMECLQKGASYPAVTDGDVKAQEISFPSLPEQQRIVALLDEAFEDIAVAEANAEANLLNARALFESRLQSVFTQREEQWGERPLGDFASFKNGLNFDKNSSGQTLTFVGVADFQDNDFAPIEQLGSATIDGVLADGYLLKRNDILIVRSNGSKHLVGRSMLIGDVDEATSYSGFVIRVRFDASQVFPLFLLRFLKCQTTRQTLTSGGGGTNITNINQGKLTSLKVPLPPYGDQIGISAAIEEIKDATQDLEDIYRRKLTALDELKKSLLHQAFSGSL